MTENSTTALTIVPQFSPALARAGGQLEITNKLILSNSYQILFKASAMHRAKEEAISFPSSLEFNCLPLKDQYTSYKSLREFFYACVEIEYGQETLYILKLEIEIIETSLDKDYSEEDKVLLNKLFEEQIDLCKQIQIIMKESLQQMGFDEILGICEDMDKRGPYIN